MDLSDNHLTYLYPESFTLHPNLKLLSLAKNRFSFFPAQFIRGLAQLEQLSLEGNQIKSLDDGDFSGMVRLRRLHLGRNEIAVVSETAFQNSSTIISLS